MYQNELRKLFLKQALLGRAAMLKAAYTPPAMPPGMDPSMMGGGMPPPGGGMPPGMDPSMMGGGMPPDMGGMGGGMPPGMDPSMMGGMPPDMGGMGGGMPPDMGGMPPTDMSGIDPTVDAGAGGASHETSARIQSAVAILREGLKQLEKAVEAITSGVPGGETSPKEASYRGQYSYDPIQNLVMYLNSIG